MEYAIVAVVVVVVIGYLIVKNKKKKGTGGVRPGLPNDNTIEK